MLYHEGEARDDARRGEYHPSPSRSVDGGPHGDGEIDPEMRGCLAPSVGVEIAPSVAEARTSPRRADRREKETVRIEGFGTRPGIERVDGSGLRFLFRIGLASECAVRGVEGDVLPREVFGLDDQEPGDRKSRPALLSEKPKLVISRGQLEGQAEKGAEKSALGQIETLEQWPKDEEPPGVGPELYPPRFNGKGGSGPEEEGIPWLEPIRGQDGRLGEKKTRE